MVEGDLLHDQLEGRDVVGRVDGVPVLEVDLVLAGSDLVMRGLDLEAHRLEGHDDVPPGVLAPVHRRQVEVPPLVVGVDDRVPGGVAADLFYQRLFEIDPSLRPMFRGNLDEQKTAIANMSRFVKPGGYLILAEGYTEGFDALTEIRKGVGLPPVARTR